MYMKTIIHGVSVDIRDLTQESIPSLAHRLSDRQKNPQFMRFLKDIPMSPSENREAIQKALAEKKSVYKVIVDDVQQKIIWCILFDSFDAGEDSLESYTRIDPAFGKLWLGTQCRRKMIAEVLLWDHVQKIISWHSAWNTWSFVINKRAWFRLMDFVPDKTFLPNIGKRTDDFKREITKEDILRKEWERSDMIKANHDTIMQWLIKHDMLHLL